MLQKYLDSFVNDILFLIKEDVIDLKIIILHYILFNVLQFSSFLFLKHRARIGIKVFYILVYVYTLRAIGCLKSNFRIVSHGRAVILLWSKIRD